MRILHQSLWATANFATAFCLTGVTSAGAKDFYAGKSPTIVVMNMPGGGGTGSLNSCTARPENTSISVIQSNAWGDYLC